jgi:hypothetical protein
MGGPEALSWGLMPENSLCPGRAALLLGGLLFFSFIYFYEGGGWNQNSRFDLVRAIVERHTLRTDAYYQDTEDRAYVHGHYYSDKAPGLAFFSLPFALIARPAMRVLGVDPESPRGALALSYVVGAGASALPAALAGVCLFFLALRFGASIDGAAFATVAMGLATPIWAYASLFWAHALAGACLIFAFVAALKLRESQNATGDFLWALAVGLAAGWATVTEYPAAPASVLLALLALSHAWPRGNGARWRVVLGVGLGATICLIVLATYLYAVFGSFTPGYAYLDSKQFTFMQQRGYLGLTYPHPDRLLKLLFGCSRGLFLASPVMVAAPVGLWLLWKDRAYRAPAAVAAAIVAYYFLFNASFYWWKSGLSFGPRYAGASFPLLCIGLGAAWERATRAWRRVLAGLAVISVFVALTVVATTSQLSMQDPCPILHAALPAFWHGEMALNRVSMLTVAEAGSSPQYGAFNLGQLLGLRGLASLIPLLVVWAIAAAAWVRVCRSGESKSPL